MTNNETSSLHELSGVSAATVPHWSAKYSFLKQTSITRWDIFFLIMTLMIAGQYTVWYGTSGGFGVTLFGLLLNALGFACFSLCLAELISTLPFSGGVYGFVRAFIPYPIFGFVVACLEIVFNLFATAVNVYLIAQFPCQLGIYSNSMVMVNCVIMHLVILFITVLDGKVFWTCNALFGIISLVLILIFIFGSFPTMDYPRWAANEQSSFTGNNVMANASAFVQAFAGIQYLPLIAKHVKNPKEDIPFVLNIATVLVTITAVFVLVTLCCQYPGADAIGSDEFPLSYGFQTIFNISFNAAQWLSIPGSFCCCFSYIFSYGRQAFTMAKSGLMPSFFLWETPFFETPYMALVFGLGFSFVLCVGMYFDDDLVNQFNTISNISAYLVFTTAFVSYIIFHRKYSSLERSFRSPLGVFGAVIGIVVFLVLIISAVGFQTGGYISLLVVFGLTFALPAYYARYVVQIFSEEEKENLFKAYLINANMATKNRLKKKYKNSSVVPQSNIKPNTNLSNHVSGFTTVTKPNLENAEVESHKLHRDLENNETDNNGLPGDQRPSEETRPQEEAGTDHSSQVPSSEADLNDGGSNAMILRNQSLSQKIMHFLSAKMNAVLPAEDTTANELAILEEGGMYVNNDTNSSENDCR